MGFLAGFSSGLTLTAGTLYLTLYAHQRHRLRQSQILRQQTLLLDSLVDPSLVPREEEGPIYRLERGDWVERWKDGWNAEVEGAVRRMHAVRWDKVREGLEARWREWRGGERKL